MFIFNEFKGKGLCVLSPNETIELVEKLEDSQMTLGSMATNRYSAPFKDTVHSWIVKLSTVGDIIEMWLIVQNMWMVWLASFETPRTSTRSEPLSIRANRIFRLVALKWSVGGSGIPLRLCAHRQIAGPLKIQIYSHFFWIYSRGR